MDNFPTSPAQLGKTLVVSPHLDDAVFSCGALLAAAPGSLVTTVLAGTPPASEMRTDWDLSCGFAHAGDAMIARREEDRAALTLLGATPIWLAFCDSQYKQTPAVLQIAEALLDVLKSRQPETLLIPAGLWHSDHVLVHKAALAVWKDQPGLRCLLYEDGLYRRIYNLLQLRLADLSNNGMAATPVEFSTAQHAGLKKEAVQCYSSQLRGLLAPGRLGHTDLEATERYWLLRPLKRLR